MTSLRLTSFSKGSVVNCLYPISKTNGCGKHTSCGTNLACSILQLIRVCSFFEEFVKPV